MENLQVNAAFQLEVAVNLLDYVVHLAGDKEKGAAAGPRTFSLVIFDRATRPIQKLRHYRFVIFGFVLKCLNNRQLYEKVLCYDTCDRCFYDLSKSRVLSVGHSRGRRDLQAYAEHRKAASCDSDASQ